MSFDNDTSQAQNSFAADLARVRSKRVMAADVRAQYPGDYDDLTDEQLQAALDQKYGYVPPQATPAQPVAPAPAPPSPLRAAYESLPDVPDVARAALKPLQAVEAVYDVLSPRRGVEQITQGVMNLGRDASNPKAWANLGSDIIEGAMRVGAPLVLPALASSPVLTVGTLALAEGASMGAEAMAKRAGLSPEYQRLAANVAALTAVGAGGKRIVGKALRGLDATATKIGQDVGGFYARKVAVAEAAKPAGLEPPTMDATVVRGGRSMPVEPVEADVARRVAPEPVPQPAPPMTRAIPPEPVELDPPSRSMMPESAPPVVEPPVLPVEAMPVESAPVEPEPVSRPDELAVSPAVEAGLPPSPEPVPPQEPVAGVSAPEPVAVGSLVRFKQPSIHGPMNVAGTVRSVRPDGALEVRLQQGGYVQIAPGEVLAVVRGPVGPSASNEGVSLAQQGKAAFDANQVGRVSLAEQGRDAFNARRAGTDATGSESGEDPGASDAANPAGKRSIGTPRSRAARQSLRDRQTLGDMARESARDAGFQGTDAELDAIIDEEVSFLEDLVNEQIGWENEFSVLEEIARNGGIGDDKGDPGEIKMLREDSQSLRVPKSRTKNWRFKKSTFGQAGELYGVPGVLRRGGMTLDYMREAVSQHPYWANRLITVNDLLDAIEAEGVSRTKRGLRPGFLDHPLVQDRFKNGEWLKSYQPASTPEEAVFGLTDEDFAALAEDAPNEPGGTADDELEPGRVVQTAIGDEPMLPGDMEGLATRLDEQPILPDRTEVMAMIDAQQAQLNATQKAYLNARSGDDRVALAERMDGLKRGLAELRALVGLLPDGSSPVAQNGLFDR